MSVNLITELERRYLEYSICTEVFDEDERIPRLLPCHHSFCSKCIKRLCRRKDALKCPTCNAVHTVMKNEPSDFPKDNTRRDLTSFLQAHSNMIAFKNSCLCGNTNYATYKCQQCNTHLCEICRRQHEIEHIRHTITVNKSEAFQNEDDNLDICQNPHHKGAKVKYFCNSANCQSVLCPICALEEHRDSNEHELEDIEAALKRRKNKLGQDVKSLRAQILHAESTKQKVQDNTNNLRDEKKDFQRKVDTIYNRGIKVLQNKRLTILDQYNICFQRENSKENTRKDNLDVFIKSASDCCHISEQLIKRNNSMHSFLNVYRTVEMHMQNYLNSPVEGFVCAEIDSEDSEEKICFDNNLQLLNRNVKKLEHRWENEDQELLKKPRTDILLKNHLKNTINIWGTYILKKVVLIVTVLSFVIHKLEQIVLNGFSLICMISKIPIMLRRLLTNDSEDRNIRESDEAQLNERHAAQTHQNVILSRIILTNNRRTTDRPIANVDPVWNFKRFMMPIMSLFVAMFVILHIRDISINMKNKGHRLKI